VTETGPRVVGLGEVLWDRFPAGDLLGGAPANFAFHAGQLGARSRIVSRIGQDPDGDRLSGELARRGLALDGLQRDPGHPTGVVWVQVSEGQPSYTIAPDAAWDFLEMTAEWELLAAETEAVCFGTLAQRHPVSRKTIQEFVRRCPAGALRVFDLNFRQAFYDRASVTFGLEQARVLKLNGDELVRVAEIFGWKPEPEAAMGQLFRQFPLQLIALTKGAAGCELRTREQTITSAAPPVQCRDAVGAGDAFSATLVMDLLRGRPLQAAADHANRVGAYVASQAGAMCEIPRELAAA
jgi:fructokinase